VPHGWRPLERELDAVLELRARSHTGPARAWSLPSLGAAAQPLTLEQLGSTIYPPSSSAALAHLAAQREQVRRARARTSPPRWASAVNPRGIRALAG